MKRKKSISKNPVAYIVLIIVLLLLIVFIVSRFDKPSEDVPGSAFDSTGVTSADSGDNAVTPTADRLTDTINIITQATEETIEAADNEWALFLLNNNNPLPEDYDSRLENDIGMTLVFEDYRDYYMDSRAAPYIMKMVEDATEDGVDLYIVSTYRTQEYQQMNLDSSVAERMSNGMDYDTAYADTLESVALPGRSEHNAGIAADIMTPSYTSMADDGFKNTKEYEWLSENAQKYGFILRYPEGKKDVTGIIYEPWHYRFVGVYYATKIKESGLTLEEFFGENGWLDENGTAIKHQGPIAFVPEIKEDPEITLPPDAITVTVNTETGPAIVV
jgi:D-alanyl-D-alanine carboxypeptidase